MKTPKTSLRKLAKKIKKSHAAAIALSFACLNHVSAQSNTSYSANSIPINGGYNIALGVTALNGASSSSGDNIGIGRAALQNVTGAFNIAIGHQALIAGVTGNGNVAVGEYALQNNTSGAGNVSCGYNALYLNTSAIYNTATGTEALHNNTSSQLTANGAYSLYSNTTGTNNCATGFKSLYANTTGSNNLSEGYQAMIANTTGRDNTATGGYNTLSSNTTGSYNTASGSYALGFNVSGFYNSAFGYQALYGNTASDNTSIGFRSSYLTTTGTDNASVGFAALYTNGTGSYNSALGSGADVATNALSNATALGSGAVVNASNKVRVGNASVTVIEGQVAFSNVSDGRFKTNVKEEDVKGLEFIKKLRPVVYNLDTKKLTEFQTKNMPDSVGKKYMAQDFTASTNVRQSGFIAQEVEAAAKAVNYNFNGVHAPADANDNYSLAYSQFVVPLVKGMQEQQKMIDDQKKLIEDLQQQVNDLKAGGGIATGISQVSLAGSSMDQNVPNPFSHETVINFNLAGQFNNAYMAIYDLSGKQLKTIAIKQQGASSITINADQMAPGMYIYSIMVDGKLLDSKRMVVEGK